MNHLRRGKLDPIAELEQAPRERIRVLESSGWLMRSAESETEDEADD